MSQRHNQFSALVIGAQQTRRARSATSGRDLSRSNEDAIRRLPTVLMTQSVLRQVAHRNKSVLRKATFDVARWRRNFRVSRLSRRCPSRWPRLAPKYVAAFAAATTTALTVPAPNRADRLISISKDYSDDDASVVRALVVRCRV